MMSAISTSGLDLYARDSCGGWRWAAVGVPQARETETRLLSELPSGSRDFLLYLPLRNVLTKLEIGGDRRADWQPLLPFSGKPIVYYGTSIVHGEGASRPGMTHAAILGRRLNRPIINLGFAGSGLMDMPIAEIMGEIDAAAYLIDCLPNMLEPMISERAEPFVRELRALRPEIPIMLIEDRTYANAWLHPDSARRHQASRQALRTAYERLRASDMANLHYVPGDDLLGCDDEATVDGSHPTDLGYFRLASTLQPTLELILHSRGLHP
jgi:hypothetical protein